MNAIIQFAREHRTSLIAAGPVFVVLFFFTFTYIAGTWPMEDLKTNEWPERLERVRNAGIVIGGVLALILAGWRGIAADRQSKEAGRQATEAGRQVETAQEGQRNERFQRSVEMLGNSSRAVQLAGIYALQRFAEGNPERYYIEVVRFLCAFVRVAHKESSNQDDTADDSMSQTAVSLRERSEGLEAVVDWIGSNRQVELEQQEDDDFIPDFSNARLQHLQARRTYDFSDCIFVGTKLQNSILLSANFTNSDLTAANLSSAQLAGACFEASDLSGADITGARFSVLGGRFATGLTARQIRSAIWDPEDPPRLEGVKDRITDDPLADLVTRLRGPPGA